MSANFQEGYTPKPMAASGLVFAGIGGIGGFLCSTSGSLQLRNTDAAGSIVVVTMAVTAGVWHSMPFAFANGLYAELTTAVGTFGLS